MFSRNFLIVGNAQALMKLKAVQSSLVNDGKIIVPFH